MKYILCYVGSLQGYWTNQEQEQSDDLDYLQRRAAELGNLAKPRIYVLGEEIPLKVKAVYDLGI